MITNLVVNAICTYYIATGNPCANTHYPKARYTIAAPRNIPLGSIAIIDGKSYVCEDRTNIKYNGRFDIFISGTREQALQLGRQTNNVTIIRL